MNFSFYYRMLKIYFLYRFKIYRPVVINMLINSECNLRCSFCDIWKWDQSLSFDVIKETINSMGRIGIPALIVSGGEPMLHEDILKVGQYAKSKKIVTTLNTNGLLINVSNVKDVIDSFDIVKVSMHGVEEANVKLIKQVEKSIGLILKHKVRSRVFLHFVVDDNNIKRVEKFVMKYKGQVDGITINPKWTENSVYSSDKLSKLNGRVVDLSGYLDDTSFNTGKAYCDAGRLYFNIGPKGYVNACSTKRFVVGNVNEFSFYDIYKKGLSGDLKDKIDKCEGCFDRCNTQVSMVIKMSPWKLLRELPGLIKSYRV